MFSRWSFAGLSADKLLGGFALQRTSAEAKDFFTFIHGQSPWSFAKADKNGPLYRWRFMAAVI